MFGRYTLGLVAGIGLLSHIELAQAGCAGIPASSSALSDFEKDPAAWLKNEGNRPLAADIRALAVAASVSPDLSAPSSQHYAGFQTAMKTLLGSAPGGAAKTIGATLGSLAASCSKVGPEETAFVTSLQNSVAQSGNQVADAAYGAALNEPQTAATAGGAGGGGDAGSGNGGATNAPSAPAPGIASNAVTNTSNGTSVRPQSFFSLGQGTGGVLTSPQ